MKSPSRAPPRATPHAPPRPAGGTAPKTSAKAGVKPAVKGGVKGGVAGAGKSVAKGSKVNRAWINDHVNDPWVKLATKEGYRARAAFKLREIDEVFGLIKPGQLVVDLGSTPGAWSQYLRRRMGGTGAATGTVIALDLLPMEPVEGVTFLLGDFREDALLQQVVALMQGRLADVVVSDMAPNLSGIAASDTARIEHLIELALEFSQAHLKPSGALVAKVFHGAGYDTLVKLFKDRFKLVKPFKPKASRDKSSETFLIGVGLKAPLALAG